MAHGDMHRLSWLFLAERYLPDADLDRLRATVSAPHGTPAVGPSRVRHRGSIWIPGDETLISSFEASSTQALERALLDSGTPADRIVRAVRIRGNATARRHQKE